MYKLGLSVYVSTFETQKPILKELAGRNVPVFTSLHIGEEINESYIEDVDNMLQWLKTNDFYVIADISPYTLKYLNKATLKELVESYNIDNIRLDFGFEKIDLVKLDNIDITYNASTLLLDENILPNKFYMHNFYPRPETGLSSRQLLELNDNIKKYEAKAIGFLTGDEQKRGPIFEGLPTLEGHRSVAPYAQFVDLIKTYKMDIGFVGDVLISNRELELIQAYLSENIILLPVKLDDEFSEILNKEFTVRIDSPENLIRVQESREYAQQGDLIKSKQTIERLKGSITIDNENYARYSGEIQITKDDFKADNRVNVIGFIPEAYHLLLNNLKNGEKFKFVSV